MDAFNEVFLETQQDGVEDYYGILNCSPYQSTEMIKAEYKRLILKCHPDRYPGDEEKATRFRKLTEAINVLADDKERALYDQWLGSMLMIPYKRWRSSFAETPPVTHWSSRQGPPRIEDQVQNDIEDPREELRQKFRHYQV